MQLGISYQLQLCAAMFVELSHFSSLGKSHMHQMYRKVKSISIYNAHATENNKIIIMTETSNATEA